MQSCKKMLDKISFHEHFKSLSSENRLYLQNLIYLCSIK